MPVRVGVFAADDKTVVALASDVATHGFDVAESATLDGDGTAAADQLAKWSADALDMIVSTISPSTQAALSRLVTKRLPQLGELEEIDGGRIGETTIVLLVPGDSATRASALNKALAKLENETRRKPPTVPPTVSIPEVATAPKGKKGRTKTPPSVPAQDAGSGSSPNAEIPPASGKKGKRSKTPPAMPSLPALKEAAETAKDLAPATMTLSGSIALDEEGLEAMRLDAEESEKPPLPTTAPLGQSFGAEVEAGTLRARRVSQSQPAITVAEKEPEAPVDDAPQPRVVGALRADALAALADAPDEPEAKSDDAKPAADAKTAEDGAVVGSAGEETSAPRARARRAARRGESLPPTNEDATGADEPGKQEEPAKPEPAAASEPAAEEPAPSKSSPAIIVSSDKTPTVRSSSEPSIVVPETPAEPKQEPSVVVASEDKDNASLTAADKTPTTRSRPATNPPPVPKRVPTPAPITKLPAEVADKVAEKVEAAQKAVDEKPVEKPVEKPAEKPAAKAADKPADKPAEKAADKPKHNLPARRTDDDMFGADTAAAKKKAKTPETSLDNLVVPPGSIATGLEEKKGGRGLLYALIGIALIGGAVAAFVVLGGKKESTQVATGNGVDKPIDPGSAGPAVDPNGMSGTDPNGSNGFATGSNTGMMGSNTGMTGSNTGMTGSNTGMAGSNTGTTGTGSNTGTGTGSGTKTNTGTGTGSGTKTNTGTGTGSGTKTNTGTGTGSGTTGTTGTTTGSAGSASTPTVGNVSADGCDKVSCVIDNFARPCCEQYKPKKPEEPKEPVDEGPKGLDKAQIQAGMSRGKAAVISCGEEHPAAKGIVKIAMVISPAGSVTSATVAASPDPALGECVAAAVRKLAFETAEGPSSFTYPFKF